MQLIKFFLGLRCYSRAHPETTFSESRGLASCQVGRLERSTIKWKVSGFLATLFVILFIGLSQVQFKSSLTTIFQNEQKYNTVLIRNLINEHLGDASQDLQHAADMITIAEGGLEAAQRSLDMIIMSHEDDFFSLSLMDLDGKILISTDSSREFSNLLEYVSGVVKVSGYGGLKMFMQ